MNIYKMKDKHLTKYSTKFNKTVFGKRAKIFATTPIVLGFVFIILLIYQMISKLFRSYINYVFCTIIF